MKPYKHVIVVKVDLDRKFFNRQSMHMNNLGKDKIALKIANVVTKIFLKQEEIISLCSRKNEYEVRVSDSSNEDNAILQEDSKAAPSEAANVEAFLMMQLKMNQYIRGLEHPKDKINPQQ